MLELEGLCTLCIVNGFAWSAKADTLLCRFAIIEVGIPNDCSLETFCIFIFRSSSLGLTKGELGMLVVEGTPVVNEGVTIPISGRVIETNVEMVEGAVTPISVEPGIARVAPTGVDTFKSLKGEFACKGCACEDDCEEDETARDINLPLLKSIHKQLGVFSNKVT